MYCNTLVVHLTLDCGAEAPCITPEECNRLGLKISPPSQLAKTIDQSKLKVIGEVRTILTRGPLKLELEALVIPTIDGAAILAGSPFFVQHEVDICYSTRSVKIGRKYSIPWTPSQFIEVPEKPSKVIRIAKATVLLKNDTVDIQVPESFPPNSSFLVYSHSDKISENFYPQEIEAVGHNLKVSNLSEEPLILEKNMHAFGIRALRSLLQVEEHKPFKQLPVYTPPTVDPQEYLAKLSVDPDKIVANLPNGKETLELLDKINKDHHRVFDSDLSIGYNGSSGPCLADWDFIQEPPVSHGKVPNYAKEDQLYKLQLKIDHLHSQGIVRKPEEVGVILKLVNPVMMVKKASANDKSWDDINPVTETRAVLAANILNEWSEDVPGDTVTPVHHLSKVTKHKYHITTDMENSFDQIKIAKKKLPYMGFNSPFKGQYIFTRSGQGRKGSSEKLKELTSMCYGHLIAEGTVAIIHDDIHVGGQTPREAVENWKKFMEATEKNNLKINAKKTKFFPKKFDCVGFTIDGQFAIPNAHRKNALKNYDLPVTVGQLRSYLGLYKTFLRNQKDQAQVLDELNQLCGNNHNTKDTIVWTEEAKLKFYDSQTKVDTIVPLYNPKPEDQLILTWDWCEKKRAIGAILWAVVDGKKLVCGYFSHMLDKSVKRRLIPCEGEALAAKLAIFAFRILLNRAKNVNIGLTDNEIFFQASRLLGKGHLSTSQKLNALTVASESAHVEIQHLSGKMGFNFASDQFSRFPSNCDEPAKCEICRFVRDSVNTCDAICISRLCMPEESSSCPHLYAVKKDDISKLSTSLILTNNFLKSEQDRDPIIQKVIWYIDNRRRPLDRDTSCNKVKSYLRYTKDKKNKSGYLNVNSKGILVVTQIVPGVAAKVEKPVIPDHLANAFLAQIHMKRNHPKLNQMMNLLQTSYFVLQPKPRIVEIINRCLICNADEFVSNKMDEYSTSEPPDHPYEKLAGDVMKRNGSLVLVVTDNLTSHTSTSLIKSEKSGDLESAMIKTILPFKNCNSNSSIRVDTAPGLQKLYRNSKNLEKFDIILDLGRQKNKNSNTVVDKRIRELEDELRKLSPEGSAVQEDTLLLATKFLNERIRQHGFSANELLFRRKQESNQELDLKDSELKLKVYEKRKESHIPSSKSKATVKQPADLPIVAVGQVGFIKQEKSKHAVRPSYFVTEVNYDKNLLKAKKMLHVHTQIPTKFQNINYEIKISDFIPAKSQIIPSISTDWNQEHWSEDYDAVSSTSKAQIKKKVPPTKVPKTAEFVSDSDDDSSSGDESNDEDQEVLSSSGESEDDETLSVGDDNETDKDSAVTDVYEVESGEEDVDESETSTEDVRQTEQAENDSEEENIDANINDDQFLSPNRQPEGAEENIDEDQLQPRRAKVNARSLIRSWIEYSGSESEEENVPEKYGNLGQIDGETQTPDSLTPDSSPNKLQTLMQKRAVRIISDFYIKMVERRNSLNLKKEFVDRVITTGEEIFDEIDLNCTPPSGEERSVFADGSYDWDNYASTPDMSGLPWNSPEDDLEEDIDTRVDTQYFFNSDFQWTSPSFRRERIKSYSEGDVRQIVPVTEFEIENQESPDGPPICFPTRVFFRRLRQSLSLSSRSQPNLATTSEAHL